MGEAVPLGRRGTIAASVATGVFFVPVYGLVPSTFSSVAVAYGLRGSPADALSIAVAVGLAPFLASRYTHLRALEPVKKRAPFRGLDIGPLKATEEDMFTSILVLGATGTGKTSRILFPALEDLMNTYSDEDEDVYSKNPYQKCGGFILEVKGKFFETAVLLAHRSGRNAATDVRVIRANSTLPVVELRDELGRRFFINGQPCSTGSEAGRLFKPYKFKDGTPIISKLFKRIFGDMLQAREEELRQIEVEAHDDIRFIGWRLLGGKLHRVNRTLKRSAPEFTGEIIEPPKKLKYCRTLYLSNGLQYNLLDPNVPSSEAAERIAMVAKMVSGEGKGGGDNAFFYQAAGKVIDCAIRLQRIIEPKRQCTVLDVYRIVAQDTAMSAALQKLSAHTAALQQRKNGVEKEGDKDSAYELGKKITSYDDLAKFFTEEWLKLKAGNTGTSIMSTISNLFGPFMRDPSLQETFCNPATFTFDDCMQKGVIFAFVPGPEYEMNARLIGTVLKMDFQSRMLQRVSEGSDSLNKNRIVLHVADECQKFIIAGSQEAGDPNFMSLSRESKVINFAATQSEAWVYSAISHNEARVWCQSYGTRVWLTQTDEETNKHASVLCGVITKEKRSHTEELNIGDLVTGKGGKASQKVGYDEKPRFEAHEFTELRDDEAICFNKGKGLLKQEMGGCKAMKGKIPWRWITAPEGNAEIADRMRWWFCETWENDIFNSGRASLLDPTPAAPVVAAVAVVPAVASAAPPAQAQSSNAAGGGPGQTIAAPAIAPVVPAAPATPAERRSPEDMAADVANAAASKPLASNLLATTPIIAVGSGPTAPAAPPLPPGPVSSKKRPNEVKNGSTLDPGNSAANPEQKRRDTESVSPAEIAKQEKAYQELMESNPFLMVAYDDFAGLDRSRANARQKSNIPAEEQALVGPRGIVGGNPAVVAEVSKSEGSSKADLFRVPADLSGGDPAGELARRTVDGLSGRAPAPEKLKDTAKETRDSWVGGL
jgi:hypothetical protein